MESHIVKVDVVVSEKSSFIKSFGRELVIPILLIGFLSSSNMFAAARPGLSRTVSTQRGIGIYPDKLALPGVVVVRLKSGIVASVDELMKVPELEGRILKEANPQSVESLRSATRIKLDKSSELLSDIYVVRYSGTVTPALFAQSLLKNPDVVYAEPHYIYKVDGEQLAVNDPLLSKQYGLTRISASQAWDITTGSASVPIGIVDTGVDWVHPDLYGNIWHNPHWQTDTDFPNDSIGWDFGGLGDGNQDPTPDNNPEEDGPHHGTHVAGIAAAIANNGIGIAGTAPGCRIMAVKVSEADFTDPSTGEPYIVYGMEGIAYAANNGARVINCSWGGVGYVQYEQDVINYVTQEGALVVAAAGNDASDEFQTPAYYDNVMSVAATDQNDNAAYFTNYSYNVSVSAPGENIMLTWDDSLYAYLSGTSMATPFASGVAALVASQHPEYSPQQILEQVRVSADKVDSLNPDYVRQIGFGRINAYRALTVSSPGVGLDDIVLSDSVGGNNDGTFTDGETVQVFGTLTDWLAPTSNLVVTLTTSDPYVSIVGGTTAVGAIGKKGTFDLRTKPLSFKVNDGVPAGHVAQFLVLITDGSYSDYKSFSVTLDPTFNQLTLNAVATTITAQGNIGFNDYPNNTQGIGFIYQPDNDSVLFEGAFMAGTSSSTEVDVARDSTANEESGDFRRESLVQLMTPGPKADQEAVTVFNDSNATYNRVGIEVGLHTYAYYRDSTQNFVILEYTVHNLNSVPLGNFYAGVFLDWDIGLNGADNMAAYDGSYQLGYAFNASRVPRTYTGCALIYGASPNFTAIDNADPNTGTYVGFNKSRKWNALTGETNITHVGPTDISMVVWRARDSSAEFGHNTCVRSRRRRYTE